MSTVDKIMALVDDVQPDVGHVDYLRKRPTICAAIEAALDMGEPVAWQEREAMLEDMAQDVLRQTEQERTEREQFEAWERDYMPPQDWIPRDIMLAAWQAALAQRKPLSDEQIDTARFAMGTGVHARLFNDIARAIEAAHGIKP